MLIELFECYVANAVLLAKLTMAVVLNWEATRKLKLVSRTAVLYATLV